MIGLDTNILIRHLTQDDERQSPIASDIIGERLTADNPGFISIVAMVETLWVLEAHYGASPLEAVAAAEGLISQDNLVVENHDDIVRAIEDVRNTRADFSDTLIARLGRKAGCSVTLTFDKRAARLPGFQLAT